MPTGRLIKRHGGVRDTPISLGWPLSTQMKTDRHEYCNTPVITSYCGLAKKKALCTPSLTAYVEPGPGERLEPGVDPTWGLWTDTKQLGNCRPNCQHVPTRNLGTEPRDWGFQPNGRLGSKLPAAPNMELVISDKWETGWKTN